MAAALAGSLGLGASAVQQTGSLQVTIRYGDGCSSPGRVELHRVAEAEEDSFRLKDRYGGGVILGGESDSPELAQWLAERAGEGENSRILDADGQTVFRELNRGLYLLIHRDAPEGYACAAPFLVPVPLNGQWEIYAEPKTATLQVESPRTGDSLSPLFGAMGMVLAGMGLWACGDRLRKR